MTMSNRLENGVTGKRLAICLSGGGSLGAYEAGAMYEVLRALKHHNEHTTDLSKHIYIDVLTGASAGSINCTLLSFLLSFMGETFVSAKNNALFEYWVKDAYMYKIGATDGLAKTQDARYSLLNAEYLGKIVKKQLDKRYKPAHKPVAQRHAAVLDSISVGMALANMTGLDFEIEYSQPVEKAFTYTRYQDEYVVKVGGEQSDHREYWLRVLEHALASGGFPFGLRCREVNRHKDEFSPDVDLDLAKWPNGTDQAEFAFIDGGLFNNQPLGLARAIAKKRDKEDGNLDRAYLYISPFEKKSSINNDFHAEDATYGPLAVQILKAMLNQSRYQELSTALGDQTQHRLFATFSAALVDTMQEQSTAANLIMQSTLSKLRESGEPGMGEIVDEVSGDASDVAMRKLLSKLLPEYGERGMTLYAITPSQDLCGGGLLTFQGFFNERYRLHDYAVGRKDALTWLGAMYADNLLGPINLPDGHEPLADAEGGCQGLADIELEEAERILGGWFSVLMEHG